MNALEILATLAVKPIGGRGPDGRPIALIGMRPRHHLLDLRGGTLNPHPPAEQALVDAGFTHLAPSDGFPDQLHPDWTVTLPNVTSYQVAYQGEVQLTNSLPTPELWGQLAREAGCCLLVLQHEAGPEVHAEELFAYMSTGHTSTVTAGLV